MFIFVYSVIIFETMKLNPHETNLEHESTEFYAHQIFKNQIL